MAFVQGACGRFGIEHTVVDGTEPGAFAAAVRPGRTMLVIAESPSNPRLDLVDLADLGAVSGPFTVVDSTFATPIGQQPLRHGDRPRAALGDQGHRRPQRRHARRRRRRARPARGDLVLRRAARRQPVAARRPQRAARHPHARRAPAPPVRRRPAPRRVRCSPTPASPPCTTRASPATRSTSWPTPSCTCLPTVFAIDLVGGIDAARTMLDTSASPARRRRSAAPRRSCATRPRAPTSASAPTTRRRSASRPACCGSRSASRTATTSLADLERADPGLTLVGLTAGWRRRRAGRRGR